MCSRRRNQILKSGLEDDAIFYSKYVKMSRKAKKYAKRRVNKRFRKEGKNINHSNKNGMVFYEK